VSESEYDVRDVLKFSTEPHYVNQAVSKKIDYLYDAFDG